MAQNSQRIQCVINSAIVRTQPRGVLTWMWKCFSTFFQVDRSWGWWEAQGYHVRLLWPLLHYRQTIHFARSRAQSSSRWKHRRFLKSSQCCQTVSQRSRFWRFRPPERPILATYQFEGCRSRSTSAHELTNFLPLQNRRLVVILHTTSTWIRGLRYCHVVLFALCTHCVGLGLSWWGV